MLDTPNLPTVNVRRKKKNTGRKLKKKQAKGAEIEFLKRDKRRDPIKEDYAIFGIT